MEAGRKKLAAVEMNTLRRSHKLSRVEKNNKWKNQGNGENKRNRIG